MATQFNGRVALFDNRGSENPSAPAMTGKLEIPVEQLDALYEQLLEQDPQSYKERKFVSLNLSVWHAETQSAALLFTGQAQLPRPKADSILPPKADADTTVIRHEQQVNSPDASELADTIAEAKDVEVDVHGNPIADALDGVSV